VASVVAVAVLLGFQLPIGRFLDATTPGLFFAVAIGRLGCFFTGCCAGRCTRSRWGVWSSDRRVGARRIPTQLLESAAGLLIGVVAAPLVLFDVPGVSGLIFVAAFAAYIVVRQLLLRLRAERREYSWQRSGLVSGERS
jgi:phosphatidylglycerol:prolipoprotein diacylglycerol transferase